MALKRAVCRVNLATEHLGTLPANAASELNVLRHDGHSLGVDGAQVGVFEETDQVSLRSFLERHDGRPLEAEISLEVLRDLANETLERELADEQLSGLLVAADLTESNCSWTVPMRLLDASGGRRGLARSLSGELLPGGLPTGGLASGLLRAGHSESCCDLLDWRGATD